MTYILAGSFKIAMYYIREIVHANPKDYKIVRSFRDIIGTKAPKVILYYKWYEIEGINQILGYLDACDAEIEDA